MRELFDTIKHIIILINDYSNFFDAISNVINIFLGIVTGVSIIIGLKYVKSYRDRAIAATFTFWSQIRIRINEISEILKSNNSLINNLYSKSLRIPDEEMSNKLDDVKKFKDKIESIINYIETTPDQMPAYIGWTEDYAKITEFLYDAIIYDICNPDDFFKFEDNLTLIDKKKYCNEVCQVMDRLCKSIIDRQNKIEAKICKKM